MPQLLRALLSAALLLALGPLAGCEEPEFQSTPILPSDYRNSFSVVRPCQTSVDHDLSHVVVLTSPEAAQAYRSGLANFPSGSVVALELYSDPSCRDLNGWAVMRKEGGGYDDGFGDWRWQELDTFRRVLSDGKNRRCTTCHVTCRPRDFTCATR
jgi:hypothetical protein